MERALRLCGVLELASDDAEVASARPGALGGCGDRLRRIRRIKRWRIDGR
jgi:hypothetical protein